MSSGLYSGVSGLALGIGLYKGVSGLWSGASGLIDGFGGADPFSGASLYLDMLSGSLDSRVAFTRGSNATQIDSTGQIVYAPANLFLRSEEFNDAVWLKTAAIITANTATAPDGTPTADTFTTAVTTSPHQVANATGMGVTFLAGVTYAASIYVKAGTSSFVQIYMATAPFGLDAFANFDLATGTLGTVGSAATASIQAVGNGWYRCSVVATATAAATGASARVNFAMLTTATAIRAESWTATGNETLFIWGAQLEPVTYRTVPGPYIATTSAFYYGPRFDYSPVTLAPLGLLIEEQRTNLLLNSLANGTSLATQSVTVTAVAHTLSFYGTGSVVLSGAAVATATGTGAYPTRTTLTFTPTAGTLTLTVTGTVQFANLEVGGFATSYIPTGAATATRNADIATMTGTNFSSWYNASEGTFFASYEASPNTFTTYLAASNGVVAQNSMHMDNDGSGNMRAAYYSGSSAVALLGLGPVGTLGAVNKIASAYKVDDFAASRNGGTAVVDTLGAVPVGVTQLNIGADPSGAAVNVSNTHIRQIAYFNTRLPDAQLEALTLLPPALSLDFLNGVYEG